MVSFIYGLFALCMCYVTFGLPLILVLAVVMLVPSECEVQAMHSIREVWLRVREYFVHGGSQITALSVNLQHLSLSIIAFTSVSWSLLREVYKYCL